MCSSAPLGRNLVDRWKGFLTLYRGSMRAQGGPHVGERVSHSLTASRAILNNIFISARAQSHRADAQAGPRTSIKAVGWGRCSSMAAIGCSSSRDNETTLCEVRMTGAGGRGEAGTTRMCRVRFGNSHELRRIRLAEWRRVRAIPAFCWQSSSDFVCVVAAVTPIGWRRVE